MKQYLRIARTLPADAIVRKAVLKLLRAIRLRFEAVRARWTNPYLSDGQLLRALRSNYDSVDAWVHHYRKDTGRRLFQPVSDDFLRALFARYPDAAVQAHSEAAAICRHEFRVLGAGLSELGPQIDWHRDYGSGMRWERRRYHKLFAEGVPKGGEILFPWWLSSFYHFIPLAKIYHCGRLGIGGVTASEARLAADEFRSQTESWIRENPAGFGVNWRSTTIVGLRLIHWGWAYTLLREAPEIPDRFWAEFSKQVLTHGRHIRENLEWFPVRTNHYLVNMLALLQAGYLLPELEEAAEWVTFAHGELTREIEHHTHSDGVVHEGSVNYHRFVGEIFLSAALLAREHGQPFAAAYMVRLERALEFLLHVTRPDGTLPRIGDAADIRLQNLDDRDVVADARHLLALGAVLFERGDFKAAAGEFPEYAFWLLGEEGAARYEEIPRAERSVLSRSFPDGGYHVLRNEELYVLFRCGELGLRGVAGHWHYDQLAMELAVNGEPVLVDPGWYRYEADPAMFRHFKSTRAHNTAVVDGRDQVDYAPFLYPPPSRPTPALLTWDVAGETLTCSGEHRLYADLRQPVSHRRTISVSQRSVTVFDVLDGEGEHEVEWNFHFAASVRIREVHSAAVVFEGADCRGLIEFAASDHLELAVEQDWLAPTYGVRMHAPVVRARWRGQLPVTLRSTINTAVASSVDSCARTAWNGSKTVHPEISIDAN